MKTNIKRYLGIVIISLFIATNVHAQSAPAQLDLQQEYQATLIQLITLLQAQVQSLMAQLEALNVKTDTIIQNQSVSSPNYQTPQSFGAVSVEQTPTPVDIAGVPDYPYVTLYGGNCGAFDQAINIKYSDGSFRDEPILATTPTGDITFTGVFHYKTMVTTPETQLLTFQARGFVKTLTLKVIPFISNDGTGYNSAGQKYNSQTFMCGN